VVVVVEQLALRLKEGKRKGKEGRREANGLRKSTTSTKRRGLLEGAIVSVSCFAATAANIG
jgi:hypothetical protein